MAPLSPDYICIIQWGGARLGWVCFFGGVPGFLMDQSNVIWAFKGGRRRTLIDGELKAPRGLSSVMLGGALPIGGEPLLGQGCPYSLIVRLQPALAFGNRNICGRPWFLWGRYMRNSYPGFLRALICGKGHLGPWFAKATWVVGPMLPLGPSPGISPWRNMETAPQGLRAKLRGIRGNISFWKNRLTGPGEREAGAFYVY